MNEKNTNPNGVRLNEDGSYNIGETLRISTPLIDELPFAPTMDEEMSASYETYLDEKASELELSKKPKFKNKISIWNDVNKPIMAIFFTFINTMIYDKKKNVKGSYSDQVELIGVLNSENSFIDYMETFPPVLFSYTVILKSKGNELSMKLLAYKESGQVRNIIQLTSTKIDSRTSDEVYKMLFEMALNISNLKGSYMTVSDNKLMWDVKELKDLTFNDVYLPKTLMDDLDIYTKLYDTRSILQRYMFSGIPGTGKTESTRAISSILNKKGVTVIKTNICDVIKQKFELATLLAPSLIILDDIDLYLGDRNSTGVTHLLGQFLDILDGVDKLPSNVGIIASTNAPHLIDLAAQRPGRFNKLLFFDELTKDNIKNIIIKALDSMKAEFDNVTDEDYNTFTDQTLIDFYKKEGSTGAFIFESIKTIKHKHDILGSEIDIVSTIEELKKGNELLEKRLRVKQIDNKLPSSNGRISF